MAPTGTVYRDDGITINGLDRRSRSSSTACSPTSSSSTQTTGYVLSECADGCRRDRPDDRRRRDLHPAALPPGVGGKLDLVGFPGGGLVLVTSDGSGYATRDGGATWRRLPAGGSAPVAAVGAGQILRYDGPSALAVWSATAGRVGTLAEFPALDDRPVGGAGAVRRRRLVGGRHGERRARGRREPRRRRVLGVRPLGAVGATVESVRVSTLGPDVYAVVTGPGGALLGIFHSTDSGAAFARTWTGGGAGPAAIAGDVVPLLDGRLLAVSPGVDDPEAGDWWLSADDGRTFAQAKDLPVVGRIDRTVAGYVANDFFRDCAAFTRDGATWRKLEVW